MASARMALAMAVMFLVELGMVGSMATGKRGFYLAWSCIGPSVFDSEESVMLNVAKQIPLPVEQDRPRTFSPLHRQIPHIR